jgi:uncharacterized protein YfaS (alpha-2-macroglobulin family)
VFIGLLILVSAAGIIWTLRRSQAGSLAPGTTAPIPVVNDAGSSQLPGNAGRYSLDIGLNNGQSQPETVEALPLATGEPLSPEEIEAILARLPALPLDPKDQTAFNLPQQSLPPPRPGNKIEETFPPLETEPTPGAVEAGPLQVLRFAPEGEIPTAPFISVTFNQPMVPIGTIDALTAQDVPMQIEPALPGTWRWLGTKTLTFEYDSELIDRLPQATEYHVTVPEGIQSINGKSLAEGVTWVFKTPPPTIVTTYPDSSPQPLDPIFFVAFDQRIDPAMVLNTISVKAGLQNVSVVSASQTEIDQDERVSQLIKDTPQGRWLAFRATEPLPAATGISVVIEPGTPSAEGPLKTTEAQSFEFSTYAPLKIEEHGCSWYDNTCPPLTPFYIRFNNPLDTTVFGSDMLRVEPEIPGVSANVYSNSIEINGGTKGQTTYTVTISGKIQDVFGQQLGKDTRLTFRVGKAEPVLVNPGGNFLTLDPTISNKVFSVYAINYRKLNLKIYAVQPRDWTESKKYLTDRQQTDITPQMPGALVEDKVLNLDLPEDTLSQVDIPLDPYMDGEFGHFVLIVEPPASVIETNEEKWRRFSQTIITWVQITQIGLDAFHDNNMMVAWATDLKDGSPLAGVRIQPNNGTTFTSGADGIARFDIPAGANYLTASLGEDQALLPRSNYFWYDEAWTATPASDRFLWYVFDDRQMYRPGEDVHIKGWLRRLGGGSTGDVGLVGEGVPAVHYQLADPQTNVLMDGQAPVNQLGGFDFVISLPENTNLGTAQLYINAEDLIGLEEAHYVHQFQVQEFRRPEFEVSARNETTGPYFAGGAATVAVEAKYYAGGGLPNADVVWSVTTSPGSYSPPNWPDFTFGNWEPWWFYDFEYPGPNGETQTEFFDGKTDATGTHYLDLEFNQQGDPAKDPQPQSIIAEATVTDVNRQAWSSRTTLLVHPADLYVGLRSDRYFVGRGMPLNVDFIVTGLDGNAVADQPVEITAGRMEWTLKAGNWVEEKVDVQTCTALSKPEPDTCSFETPLGGSYQITAIVTDELGRKNQTRFTRWVTGGEQPPSRKVEKEQVTLIPDQESYQPGDTAQILVQAPFSPAEGLLTVTRSGILYTTRFMIENGSATLNVPIEEEHIPNLHVQVDLVGSAPRTDDRGEPLANVPPRPAYASGQLKLSIPPLQRTLSLEAVPEQTQLEPGGETTLVVRVTDARGLPVADAELAVVAVDEAILALTNYELIDPLSVFYAERPSYLESIYGHASIVLADPQALAKQALDSAQRNGIGAGAPAATEAPAAEEAADQDAAANQQTPIDLRSDFNPLATFAPTVRTGSNGEARVFIKLPDNLTRYRVMVVAVDKAGSQFGMSDANITARLPLMVRPSAPRFLNFGDTFELPVVLQNQTDSEMTVDVVARASNLELANAGLRVSVPANNRVEVRFPAATVLAGTVRLQIAATSGDYDDAATIILPVYTPATSEAFATYGVIDEGSVAQPVLYPADVFPQYGGLEVNTSSTALQALTDAVLYLVSYPYEGSDHLASRILAVSSLRDVLTAFKAKGLPSPAEMESAVQDDIERLRGLQNDDGGFPYWRRGFESIPFNTIHVAHALFIAEQKGFNVPAEVQQNALSYLRDIESHYPSWYSQETRWTLSTYALYVRDLMGDQDAGKAERLLNEAGLERLSMEAIGWLWPVIDDPAQRDAIRLFVNNHVVETAGAANFTTSYTDQTYLLLSSDRRTDAILLDALIEDNPQSDLIPKVVNGLLAHRTKGRWENIQENVFVLLALDRYFNTYEAQTPDFVARIWLGNTYAGSNEFRGRTTDLYETLIPMNYVLSETAGGMQDLLLGKEGPGRLYYRLGLQYAPTDLDLDPLEMGFVVQRRYEAIDDPEDVYQDNDGVWHIKAGARVRVKITMVADNRRYHVALVDPVPAGLEIINPALEVSETIPQDPTQPEYRYTWWWGPWYEHQNMRDHRAEAFASLLWDGVYEYTYVARATTPGTFVVPPAKAEEMYSPEVFGRSGSDRVIVESP